jgi:hypothetical protein
MNLNKIENHKDVSKQNCHQRSGLAVCAGLLCSVSQQLQPIDLLMMKISTLAQC